MAVFQGLIVFQGVVKHCSFPGAIILKIAFGYNIEPKGHDYLVDFANEANTIFSDSGQPGRWLVDIIPACTSCAYLANSYINFRQ